MTLAKKKKKLLEEIAKKYSLELLLLFGSRVSKKTYFGSDFDIAYLAKRELTGKEIINLNCDLMDLFHSDKIDMVNLKRANPFLTYEIAKNCKLLFGKQQDFLEFKAVAFRKYIDALSLFELQEILMRKRHEVLRQKIYG